MRERGWTLAAIVSNSSVGRLCSDFGEVILLLAWDKSLTLGAVLDCWLFRLVRGQWAKIATIARGFENEIHIG